MIRVFGQITDASGKGVAGAMIELRALKSSTEVLYGSVFTYKCDASGHYEFPLAIGAYDAYAQNDICGDMDYIGIAVVTADTNDGDLHHILVDGGINITPPMLDAAMEFALRAEIAATSAESDRIQTGKDVIVTGQNKQVAETKAQESATSADEAKVARDSIVQDANEVRLNTQQVADNAASVASNTALVQRKAEQVAQNTQTVSTKAQQVSENTQSVAANTQAVTQMRDEVVAKTSMAQAAADTSTQKAASAAEHDAAAAEYARQAQEAAQATAGALMDGGAADLSAGVYPQPVLVSGAVRPTFWKVTNGGTVGGIDYGVGDTLIYTVAGSGSYYKIDNTESVTSVQGEKGAVTLTPEKIGAEPAGAASAGIQQHISAPDPHSQYAKKTEVDSKGSALAAINEHAGGVGVHSISGVIGLEQALAELNKYIPKRLFWTPTWWTNARTLRFMDMRTLWTAAGGSGNPSNDNLASYRFDVVLSISCPAANVWDHHYAFSIHRPVANNDGVNWYVYPSSFTGHTAYNKGDIYFQTVPKAENNGYGYWELRAPVDLQGVQGLNVYGEAYAYRLY
ncbi:prophage tail fiber N-terminal domain-containing protein [Plesiomonas shigelloides]|uniref:prophage tail fiber N-terminal domain-containing protein n=1 Tax=Plesiomonas shigelloides TaxID=703 RepID=UPI00387EF854